MKKLFFSAILVLLSTWLFASGTNLQKTYTWKYNVSKDARIAFDNYDCNLVIHTWDKGETEYHLTIDADIKSDEDAAMLDNYVQNMKFSSSSTSVSYKDNFWESRNTINGNTTMKLINGKKISISQFSMKGELWVPATCHLEIGSKYSEVHLEDFAGSLILDLYNDNFFGGNVKGKTNITDKYSTVEFKEMKDVKADLYNSKFQAVNMGNLEIVSKYTKISALACLTLTVDGYNDNYSFTRTGDINFVAKYTDLKSDLSGKVVIDCYEGSVILKEAKDIRITSKYADFQFGNAENVTVTSSYNDKLESGRLKSLKITESKYCSYKIDELSGSVSESDGYEDKFRIGRIGQDFSGFSLSGKYLNATISLLKSTDYRVKAKIQYPKIEMNESQLKLKVKVVDGSNLEYDAVKGTEKEGMPVIEVNGYEVGLKITEI